MSDLPPSRRDERLARLAEIEAGLAAHFFQSHAQPDLRWLIAEVRSLSQQLDEAKADSARLDFLDSVEEVSVDLPSAVGARRLATYSLYLRWRADRGDDALALRTVLDAAIAKNRSQPASPRA